MDELKPCPSDDYEGCKTCPVAPCETMVYRGSTCAAKRARYGLGDPQKKEDSNEPNRRK